MLHKVHIEPHWQIEREAGRTYDTYPLLQLLKQVQQSESIAEAARLQGLSYRHAWGLVRQAETRLGARLLDTKRGSGARLTRLAEVLIWADKRIAARLSPTLQSLASELAGELDRLTQPHTPAAKPALRLRASHGFAVAALLEQMAAERLPVELSYRNSSEALASLARRNCDMAGFHVPLGQFEAAALAYYSRWLDTQRHVLLHLAVRSEGLFVAPGNPKRIQQLRDLARPDVRFVNRQQGSGTRMLIDLMLAKAKLVRSRIRGYETTELTHAAVAAHVASDMADVGIGVELAARRFGLEFVPLVRERYFFAVERDALGSSPVRELIVILQGAKLRKRIDALAGYDATHLGRIETPVEAFGAIGPAARRGLRERVDAADDGGHDGRKLPKASPRSR